MQGSPLVLAVSDQSDFKKFEWLFMADGPTEGLGKLKMPLEVKTRLFLPNGSLYHWKDDFLH